MKLSLYVGSSQGLSVPSVMVPLAMIGKSSRQKRIILESYKHDRFNQVVDSPTECGNETATFSLLSPTDLSPQVDVNRSQIQTEISKETTEHFFPNVIIKEEGKRTFFKVLIFFC